MSIRKLILIPSAILTVMLLLVAKIMYNPSNAAPSPSQASAPERVSLEPKLIGNPTEVPILAEGPGKDVYTANCLNCHSARYVTMQPRFTRRVWTAEVAKMVAAYKAPVAPADQPAIVNYLVTAYGTEDHP